MSPMFIAAWETLTGHYHQTSYSKVHIRERSLLDSSHTDLPTKNHSNDTTPTSPNNSRKARKSQENLAAKMHQKYMTIWLRLLYRTTACKPYHWSSITIVSERKARQQASSQGMEIAPTENTKTYDSARSPSCMRIKRIRA